MNKFIVLLIVCVYSVRAAEEITGTLTDISFNTNHFLDNVGFLDKVEKRNVTITYSNLGCWSPNPAIPSLERKSYILDGNSLTREDSITKCATLAHSLGFTVFAMQNYGVCFSSKDAESVYDVNGPMTNCEPGNGRGVTGSNQVYKIINTEGFPGSVISNTVEIRYNFYEPHDIQPGGYTVIHEQTVEYENVGCYQDNVHALAIPTLHNSVYLLSDSYVTRKDAVAKCAAIAYLNGFEMFAVQNGGFCLSSATAEETYNKYGKSVACLNTGRGAVSTDRVYRILGGSNKVLPREVITDKIEITVNALNKLSNVDVIQSVELEVTFANLGCWLFGHDRSIPTLESKGVYLLDGFYANRKDALIKCAATAYMKNYPIFGLWNNGSCASGPDANSTYQKFGDKLGLGGCYGYGKGGHSSSRVWQITGGKGKPTGIVFDMNVTVEADDKDIVSGSGYTTKQNIEVSLKDLGCWKDSTTKRALVSMEGTSYLLKEGYTVRKNAIQKCAVLAYSRGYTVFGMEFGGQCYGSETSQDTYQENGQSTTCADNGKGGSWVFQVYEILEGKRIDYPIEPITDEMDVSFSWIGIVLNTGDVQEYPISVTYEDIGCWKDTGVRAIAQADGSNYLLSGAYTVRADAIEKCAITAYIRNYTAFGVQHGGWCAGSKDAINTYDKYGGADNCVNGKGGYLASSVYKVITGSGKPSGIVFDMNVTVEADDKDVLSNIGYTTKQNIEVSLKNLGCWKDSTTKRALVSMEGTSYVLKEGYTVRKNAIQKCAVLAYSRGYTVFGMEFGGQCYGSETSQDTYQENGEINTCATTGKGGSWAFQVYEILEGKRIDYPTEQITDEMDVSLSPIGVILNTGDEVKEYPISVTYEDIGCWKDTGVRAIAQADGSNYLLSGSYTVRADAIEKCAITAYLRNYTAFGVQHGGWCAGSKDAIDTYDKYGGADNCVNGKGGYLASSVYKVITGSGKPSAEITNVINVTVDRNNEVTENEKEMLTHRSIEVTYENLGCYKDTTARAIASLEGTSPLLDIPYTTRKDPVTKCAAVAFSRDFPAFAIQNGGQCYSSATADETYAKYGEATNCAKNGEGGPNANRVYNIIQGSITDYTECDPNDEVSRCHPHAVCTVENNGFKHCVCNTGFTGSGVTCEDIDECALALCPAHSTCFNSVGSYDCKCSALRAWNGVTCVAMGLCGITGDPHHSTFDKTAYNYQGMCKYYAAKTYKLPLSDPNWFQIIVKNKPFLGSQAVSIVEYVEIILNGGRLTLRLTLPNKLQVNGQTVLSYNNNGVVAGVHGKYVLVHTDRFAVHFALYIANIYASPVFMNQLNGLCGSYNGNSADDFTANNGQITGSFEFAESYLVEDCDKNQKVPVECDDPSAWAGPDFCGPLIDDAGVFGQCLQKVNPKNIYEDCIYDMCASDGNKELLTQNLKVLADKCNNIGVNVCDWRTRTNALIDECPENSHYEGCSDPCPVTCETITGAAICLSESQVEACVCDTDYVESGDECVHVSNCGCNIDGAYIEFGKGYTSVVSNSHCKCIEANKMECTCLDGYNGDPCVDIDECLEEIFDCGDNTFCNNTDGFYDCVCIDGFIKVDDNCEDANECEAGNFNCGENAECRNTDGSYVCECRPGFTGDGQTCTDIDECQLMSSDCNMAQQCVNTIGSYECECKEGHTGDGTTCTDIDECATGTDNCNDNAFCFNSPGSYQCDCNEGYVGDGITCIEIQECMNGKVFSNCDHCEIECGDIYEPQPCAADCEIGCKCPPGTFVNEENCVSIFECPNVEPPDGNECETGNSNCDENAECRNTDESYVCECRPGFTGDGQTCTDIDECQIMSSDCNMAQQCVNTIGSYECECKEGHTGDGTTCTDIDECATGTDNCNDNAFCFNSPGSYQCDCNEGYVGDGITCIEIQECMNGKVFSNCDHCEIECEDIYEPQPCAADCEIGCKCPPGTFVNEDNCVSIFECPNVEPSDCTGGRHFCTCHGCEVNCEDRLFLPHCEDTCQSGCFCPEGQFVLDGECVTEDQCPEIEPCDE